MILANSKLFQNHRSENQILNVLNVSMLQLVLRILCVIKNPSTRGRGTFAINVNIPPLDLILCGRIRHPYIEKLDPRVNRRSQTVNVMNVIMLDLVLSILENISWGYIRHPLKRSETTTKVNSSYLIYLNISNNETTIYHILSIH